MKSAIEKDIKAPETDYDLHPLIQKRWSPRAFADQLISKEQLNELFEAARWAASSRNEQPWLYIYAFRGTPEFEQLWECLMPGNQPWAKDAAVLMVSMYRTTLAKNGKPNGAAKHDLGLANAQLILQAAHRDIYGHMMGGFEKEKVQELLDLEENVEPVCMIALGYMGDADQLEEPYKMREQQPRTRMPIAEFAKKL